MPIVFYKVTKKEDEKGQEKKRAILQYSTVFNIAQVDGIAWKLPEPSTHQHTPQEGLQQVVNNYANGPRIFHKGSEAVYRPAVDTVTVPEIGDFHTVEDYAQTLLHELVHSTGHPKRLDRATLTAADAYFGSESYAKEELIAELGASFLSAAAGIDLSATIQSTANYLANWLTALRNDKTLIVSAASLAQKASNHILGIIPSYEAEEVAGATE